MILNSSLPYLVNSYKKPNASAAIPDELWRKIFTLAKTHTASKIRSLLGISTKQYNSKYEQMLAHTNTDKEQCRPPI